MLIACRRFLRPVVWGSLRPDDCQGCLILAGSRCYNSKNGVSEIVSRAVQILCDTD